MVQNFGKQDGGPKFSRVSFWIGLATILVLFALLAFGSILGIIGLIRCCGRFSANSRVTFYIYSDPQKSWRIGS